MKRLLLCILFFIFSSATAQTNVYHPFPDSGAVWNVSITGTQCSECYQRSYYISGDTIINATSYHKINYSNRVGILVLPDLYCTYNSPYVNTDYAGAIREDTAQRKVYFVLPGQLNDSLLYDFALGVGDTLPWGYNTYGWWIPIISIDSILIGNNYRKRFILGNTVNVFLIEGIGSTTGLLEHMEAFPCGGYLNCFSQSGQTLYPDTSWQCDIIAGKSEIGNSKSGILLSPNPFTTTLTLHFPSPQKEKAQLTIFNSIGEAVVEKEIRLQDQTLNLAALPQGIYLVRVIAMAIGREKGVFTEKVIKNIE